MSLLTICQNAADEIGISQPSTIVGNTDSEARKLLRYSNRVGTRLMKKVPWGVLRAEETFTALNQEIQTGILPSGFDRFIPETFWDRTNRHLLSGPVTPVEWNSIKSANTVGGRKFILRADQVHIYPIMSGGQVLAFEYVTENWVLNASSVAKASFTVDTDTSRIDEELITKGVIWAFLQGEGLPYLEAKQEFNDYFDIILENDQPDSGIMVAGDIFGGGRHFTGEPGSQSGDIAGDGTASTWDDNSNVWGS